MRIINGGNLVVETLIRQGATQVFSIAGGQMGTMYDAIGKSDEIEMFTPRNETTTALMAAGFTASTGKPSVAMTTVGAGVVYEVAGLLKAWLDYLPVISVSPQVQSWKMKPHQESLQSCNQDELFAPITKWNAVIYQRDRIPQLIDRAFREMFRGATGPVHLDIPVDVLFGNLLLTAKKERRMLPPAGQTRYAGAVSGVDSELADAGGAFQKSEKPLVIVGQGFGRKFRDYQVRAELKSLGAPALTTSASCGIFSSSDDCFAGEMSIYLNSEAGRSAIGEADLIIVAGLDHYSAELVSELAASGVGTIIQIENDPTAFGALTENTIPVYCDPSIAIAALAKSNTKPERYEQWCRQFRSVGTEILEKSIADLGAGGKKIKGLAEKISGWDCVIADGKYSDQLAHLLQRQIAYEDMFIVNRDDIAGGGLPFAIGAAIGGGKGKNLLLTDKQDIFHHLRELQPALDEGVSFAMICLDLDREPENVADIGAVLSGLGCAVKQGEAADASAIDHLRKTAGIPCLIIS